VRLSLRRDVRHRFTTRLLVNCGRTLHDSDGT
jgi:hypothetical protein